MALLLTSTGRLTGLPAVSALLVRRTHPAGWGVFVLVERAGHMVDVTHPGDASAAVLRLLDAVRRDVTGEQPHGEAGRGPDRRA
ncbi:hypothetical protein BH24ACT10_BH24ACT10_14110 [soil metagenome]